MTKGELVTAVSTRCNIAKQDVERILESFQDVVVETLARGEDVKIVGFGTFKNALVPAREARNPKTGEPVSIAEGRRIKFKASPAVNDQLPVRRGR